MTYSSKYAVIQANFQRQRSDISQVVNVYSNWA